MQGNATSRYFNSCFDVSNPGLRAYFSRTVKGQSEVYDTPFAKGESTKDLMAAWMTELKSISGRWPSLWEFENDLAKKVGPMSVMQPLSRRLKDIDSYYSGVLLPGKDIDSRAISAAIQEFRSCSGLRVRSAKNTLASMKLSTNSGSPFFKHRKYVQNVTLNSRITTSGSERVQNFPGLGSFGVCAVLGWRGQEGGPKVSDVKQRIVWMFPFAVNLQELRVYQPMVESFQKHNIVPAWVSFDEVDRRITAMFDTKAENDLVVCTDFSKFDQHFNEHLSNASKEILASLLTPGRESAEWLDSIFPIKYTIPLAYDWGRIRFGKHGMGSGSGGTNADETLAHRSLQYEAAILQGAKLNPNSQCLGDDGVLTYPGITVEDVVDAYQSHGLDMNPDKQYASTQDCVYLRRWHHKQFRANGVCVGVYSTCRALGRLRYLERYQDPKWWGPTAVALRQLSILENCKWHPLKEQFVKFCMKRDKYRLGIDIPNFLDRVRQHAEEINDHMHDFLGYTKSEMTNDPVGGIDNWWVVNFLRSQR